MTAGVGLIFDLLAKDHASPAFLRVAGAADKAAASTERATRGLASSLTKAGKAGAALTKGLTLPLLGIGAVAVDQAAKYQKAMTLLQTAGGETARNMGVVSKGIENIAVKTGTSLSQLSDGMYVVEKAGIRGAAGLKVLKAAAEGAKAENVDLGTAVNALTSVMMSYHLSADKAVSVENMLIRGSGMAKTSMQEYAGSLSTVIPIASAAGINFAQVAGAIATLTQHGTSAQESTQELANTIRNLQAPNNVAVKAMSQLGLKVTDVEQGLGRRGLTGTIDLLTHAIQKKMGPSGLVVVSAFKKSQSASADLNLEISKMPAHLADLSKQFLSGHIGYSAYNKSIKGLSAAQYEMGKSFVATLAQAKGFNDLLKQGNPAAQTFAAYLKQVMGGATGLNTALMLGGENMRYFTAATKDVSKAALQAGTDVLGWNKTSQTLDVRMASAKESLQVLAVEIGTALIPAVSKLADEGTKVVHWFDSLSGTQKKILMWSAGFLAALGPVLSIGTKLTLVGRGIDRFAVSAATRISSLAGASEETTGKVIGATRLMVRGVSGVLAGAAASQIGGNSSGGWLASIMLGAAGGWALSGGNPVGAAIGGISSAIFKGIGLWNDHKKAAQAAAAAERADVANLTSAIEADNGALGTNLKLQITKQLQDKGILDKAQKLGVSLADVVSAAMGNARAKKNVAGALAGNVTSAQNTLDRLLRPLNLYNEKQTRNALLSGATNLSAPLSNRAGNRVSLSASQLRSAQSAIDLAKGSDALTASLRKEGIETVHAKQKADQYAHALNDNRVASGSLKTQLDALRKHTSLAVDTNGQLTTSLARSSVVGQHNRATLTSLAAAAVADANNTFAAAEKHHTYGQALQIASGKLSANIGLLESSAKKAGLNKGKVDELIQSLKLYSQLHPQVNLGLNTGPAESDLQRFINSLPTITVNAQTRLNLGSTYNSQVPAKARQHKAAGGGVNDGYFTVGERGWELGYKSGSSVHIFDNKTSQKLTGMARVPGYASGTHLTGSNLQSAVSSASALLAAAHNIMATASELASAAKDLRNSAKDQKASAAVQRDLARDATRLGRLATARDRVTARLGSAPTAPTAYDRLATAQQAFTDARTSVSGAVGAFDITTAGRSVYSDQPGVTASSILGQLRTAATKAQKFGGLLRTLIKKGLPKDLVMQLAQAGPAAFDQAQALSAATPGELAGIKSSYGALTGAGSGAGSLVANAYYKNGVDAANALVKGLKSQQSTLNREIRALGDRMVSEFEHGLGIKQSPSIGHAASSHHGKGHKNETHFHVHGIEDPATFVRKAETIQARRALARV